MIASTSPGSIEAAASACRAAASPRSTPVSPGEIHRRSRIPVRVRIHSSLVSISSANSALVTVRSGNARPVPRMIDVGIQIPRVMLSNLPPKLIGEFEEQAIVLPDQVLERQGPVAIVARAVAQESDGALRRLE